MSYSFLDQQNLLSSLLGDSNTDTSSQWPLAQRKTEINHAEKQFARDTRMLLENATGVIADLELALPAGWFHTFAFYVTVGSTKYRIDNNREISVNDLERWTDYGGDIPYYYYWGFSGTRKIKLIGAASNINGSAYDFYYFQYPTTDLSADGDTSIIPEEYRQAPVYKAASNLLMQVGQYTRAQQQIQLYDRLASQAKSEAGQQYLDYDQPRPDMNIIDSEVPDRQGQGWPN